MNFMIKRLPLILLLSSCAQFTFTDYVEVIDEAFSKDIDVNVTTEYIATREFSFAKVKMGDNPPAILSLAHIKGNLFTWISSSGEKFITKHGKIIETHGLEHNFKLLNSISHSLPILKSEQLVELNSPNAVLLQTIDPRQKKSALITLDKDYDTDLYVEDFTSTPIKWSGKNYYWVDKVTNLAIRTHQDIHPLEENIEIEFFYIFK